MKLIEVVYVLNPADTERLHLQQIYLLDKYLTLNLTSVSV